MAYVRRMNVGFALLAALGFGVWIAAPATWPSQAQAWVTAILHPLSSMQARLEAEPASRVRAQLGGAVTKVAVGDGHIFAGVGPRLIMFDGAAMGDPVELARSDPLPARVKSLAALDGAIAVGYGIQDEGGPNGLALFSSGPSFSPGPNGQLQVQGMLPLKGVPVAMLVDGDILIVATRRQTTDDRPPPTASPVDAAGDNHASPGNVTYHGGEVLAVDVAQRTAPRVVGTLALDEVPSSLGRDGGTVFVMTTAYRSAFDGSAVLQAVDVSDPVRLRRIGSFEVGESGTGDFGLAVQGSFAFAAIGEIDPGVAVIDIHDPNDMRKVANINSIATSVAVVGHMLYIQDVGEVEIVDVTDASQPQVVGTLPTYIRDVVVDGDRLVAAENAETEDEDETLGNFGGVGVYSIADGPQHPMGTGAWRSLVGMTSAAATADRVYVTVADSLVAAIDTSDPGRPQRVGAARWQHPGWSLIATDMALANGTVAMIDIGSGGSSLYLAKLGAAGVPQPSTAIDLDAHAVGIAADGPLVAVLVEEEFILRGPPPPPVDKALRLYRLADDGTATLAGETAVPGSPVAVVMRGSVVYVATTSGLHVVDVADPSRPTLVRSMADVAVTSSPFDRQRISLGGEHLAVAIAGGLRLFDVADALMPRAIGDVAIDDLQAVAVSPSLVFIASPRANDTSHVAAYSVDDVGGRPVFEAQLPSPVRSLTTQGDVLVAITEETGIYWLSAETPPDAPHGVLHVSSICLPYLEQPR